jgi:phage shock protein PspC (stress-responsive transcriptional regulator)
MNKVLNINLGGYPLTIDEDAHAFLERYLRNIEVRFHELEGRADIMRDIEMRLGELLTAELGPRRIVMFPDVQEVVRIMGQPEDFGSGPVAPPLDAPGDSSHRVREEEGERFRGIRTGRRLFRDKDEKIAGGVCSGLSAYLGIDDPLWLRLAFVLMTIVSSGSWIVAYLIAWALIPESQSAADRLSMRGEPINVDNIAREIETGFQRLESEMDSMGRRSRERGRATAGRIHDVLGDLMGLIGSMFAALVRFMGKFGVALMVLILIAVVIKLFA